jgi:hypothetical protein
VQTGQTPAAEEHGRAEKLQSIIAQACMQLNQITQGNLIFAGDLRNADELVEQPPAGLKEGSPSIGLVIICLERIAI